MRQCRLGFGLMVVLAGGARAQDWVGQWDGPDGLGDIAWAVAVDSSGALAVSGPVRFAATGTDIGTVMYDAAGNLVWEAFYAGSGAAGDYSFDAKFDGAGNVLVSGSGGGPGGSKDLILLKYDPLGNELWARTYDGPGQRVDGTESYCLRVDSTDHIVQCGYSDVGGGDYDGVVLRYAPDGTLLWTRNISGKAGKWDGTFAVFVDEFDDIYVASDHSTATDWDLAVTKFDPSGTLLWESYLDVPGVGESPFDLRVDAGGNVFVAGITRGGVAEEDALLARFDASGALSWYRTYDGPTGGSDYAFGLNVDGLGGAVITGYSEEGVDTMCLTARYDANGNLRWVDRYDPTSSWWGGDTWGTQVEVDAAGNSWVSVNAYVDPFNGFDATVLLYSPTGTLLKVWAYNGPVSGNDSFFGIDLDEDGNAYAAGLTLNTSGDLDFLAVRFDSPLLKLTVNTNQVQAGDNLALTLEPGLPGATGLLAALDVNGTPLFLVLRIATFDALGQWSWNVTVPQGLIGLEVTFGGFGIDQWGRTMATNQEMVSFQ